MTTETPSMGAVTAVSRSATHSFSKPEVDSITLLAGLGVDGDAHLGKTVKHRSRVAKDPSQPNLRQVHLIHEELHTELVAKGFRVGPGIMGENITTRGVALLDLPRGTRLHIGQNAIVDITGLRNPCKQLNDYQEGLMYAVLDKTEDGALIRRSGVMGVVVASGDIRAGDAIKVELPDGEHHALEPV